jgi:predicted transcriptional regulator
MKNKTQRLYKDIDRLYKDIDTLIFDTLKKEMFENKFERRKRIISEIINEQQNTKKTGK